MFILDIFFHEQNSCFSLEELFLNEKLIIYIIDIYIFFPFYHLYDIIYSYFSSELINFVNYLLKFEYESVILIFIVIRNNIS